MVAPIFDFLLELIVSSSRLIILLILVTAVISIIIHVLLLIIERIIKISVRPIVDTITFPGVLMKNAWIKLIALFFGYNINMPIHSRSNQKRIEMILYPVVRSPLHLFTIIFSPYLNLVFAAILIATRHFIINLLPQTIIAAYNIAIIYLSLSIVVSGTPTAQDVYLFISTIVQNSPWFFILTVWGIIATTFMKQILGLFPAITFMTFYEILLILLELKNDNIIIHRPKKQNFTANNFYNYLQNIKDNNSKIMMIIIDPEKEREN